jgi:hypothetical protein
MMSATKSPDSRAALLCAHARELSDQCIIAFRHGIMDTLCELQGRKHLIVQELASLLKQFDLASHPSLAAAVQELRVSLREETRLLAEGAGNIRQELMCVNAAQRRLTQAQQYDTGEGVPVAGAQLSICG